MSEELTTEEFFLQEARIALTRESYLEFRSFVYEGVYDPDEIAEKLYELETRDKNSQKTGCQSSAIAGLDYSHYSRRVDVKSVDGLVVEFKINR
ncbi:MAG: hypothetical protein COV36_07265 [Alphaproteobacteria bacterium CG11_big_fil_rev_8_21_14_0_20_44_7]|nr:MAG: hypothetical protein COV36_07265 [Alphaproteobacteria bacterium CG11_big_fil_rev_8_21_14_0_20_44_7]